MGFLVEYHSEWLEHNNKVIVLNGMQHKIQVSTYRACYPYETTMIAVFAECLEKDAPEHIEIARQLGDAYVTDVLTLAPEVVVDLLTQCDAQN